MNEFISRDSSVTIQGKEYKVRELSLAQKIKVVGFLGNLVKDLTRNAFFRKDENGNIHFDWNDEVSLAELNVDKIILSSLETLPELLKLSIPDFTDWDNLPESQTREILPVVMTVNDVKGFVINFFSLATAIIR